MYKFLRNIIIITIIFFTPFIAMLVIRLNTHVDMTIPEHKNTIVLGNSNTECGVNDSLIYNWLNVSSAGAPMYVSYYTMRELVKANPQIDTVIMCVSCQDFDHRTQMDFNRYFDKFLLRLPIYDHNILHYFSLTNLKILLPFSLESYKECFFSKASYVSQLGKYRYNHCKSKLKESVKLGDWKRDKNPDINITCYWLDKIVDECRNRNIKLIFIHTPYYNSDKYFNVVQYDSIINAKYSDIELWNYRQRILPDSCYRDIDHLTGPGARVFTELLIKEKHLNKNNVK